MIENATHQISESDQLSGFRMVRLEVLNWGTFDRKVWALDLNSRNTLLTGDIGSGKSTLVDAITTLLVPAYRVAFNKAAGADTRERTLRSYVLGHYKSERNDVSGAKPVALRSENDFSVLLGVFRNIGYNEIVTLTQVFWFKDAQSPPARMYVTADREMSIAADFSNFASEAELRKKLRKAGATIHDSFPSYGSHFRRRFGIQNDQALELFHQTVSMKSVGNLTDFVRTHMLEPFDVESRIGALIAHFDDLNRAHEAVLRAKAQVERLIPIVDDCASHNALTRGKAELESCRDTLMVYFTGLRADLLRERMAAREIELLRLAAQVAQLVTQLRDLQATEIQIRLAISQAGGDRISRLAEEIATRALERDRRMKRAEHFKELVVALGLSVPSNTKAFVSQRMALVEQRDQANTGDADIQNALTDSTVTFKQVCAELEVLKSEIVSLKNRRSNIDQTQIVMRREICTALQIAEGDMPFAGELIQVRDGERDWEGAAERLLRNFALSLLVPERHYASVANWVDKTHLSGRLVYFRVRDTMASVQTSLHPGALMHKLALKTDSPFFSWLERELMQRANVTCCQNLDELRRETRAITRSGQIKGSGERHEKDDRHRIDDRSRYVLGWTNQAKIEALQAKARVLEDSASKLAAAISDLQAQQRAIRNRVETLNRLESFRDFDDIDWRSVAASIAELSEEKERLERSSDVLKTLTERLNALLLQAANTDSDLKDATEQQTRGDQERNNDTAQLEAAKARLVTGDVESRAHLFPRIEAMRIEALGERVVNLRNCDDCQHETREWIQRRIDAESKKIERTLERVVSAMRRFRDDYPLDTQEMDTKMEAADEYAKMLSRLQTDDLPRFESRFKQLLNENTIREVANFQSQLRREQQTIRERIENINESLTKIDYNPGRYILLEAEASPDKDVRDFHTELRECTEGTLTGSEDEQYSEAKFLQVKRIIERFRGREGLTEMDRRWTTKVSDVRNSFVFAASERWREDGSEHEHYSDSGGKSGGQKEKLAYTILAASLAYQFGLEWGGTRSRTFRFVVIDEAFGRGSDDSTTYGLQLFERLNLQLLVVTPLQKIHIIEPFVLSVGFVHNDDGSSSMLRNLTIDEFRAERAARQA